MNYERLYSYRFRDIDQDGRAAVWNEIAPHVHGVMGRPQKVLDPAAGRGEFIGAVPAKETWAVDAVSYEEAAHKPDTTVITAMIMDAELPENHFDGVFVSNFLEHLYDQEAISAFLEKMHASMEQGGRIAIMGPNYRYCSDEYWDCADHYVALTHMAIGEHLYTAGFETDQGDPPLPPLLLPRNPPPLAAADPALPEDAAGLEAARQAVPGDRPEAVAARSAPRRRSARGAPPCARGSRRG